MIRIDERTWKAVMHEVADLRQINSVDGLDAVRTYYKSTTPVAWMRVIGAQSDQPGYECRRMFEATKKLVLAAKKHYIPTDNEWLEFDELTNASDEGWLCRKGLHL